MKPNSQSNTILNYKIEKKTESTRLTCQTHNLGYEIRTI